VSVQIPRLDFLGYPFSMNPFDNVPYSPQTQPFAPTWTTTPSSFGSFGNSPPSNVYEPSRSLSSPAIEDSAKGNDIFSISPVGFSPPAAIRCIVTNNDVVAMALENGHVIRLNLSDTRDWEDIEVVRGQLILKMFLDPTGNFLIITVNNEDTYFLAKTLRKPLKIRMKGIESIAWQRDVTNPTAGIQILAGTTNGQIYEGFLKPDGSLTRYKVVYTITGEKEGSPITGLVWEPFPGDDTKFFVLAAVPDRVIQFVGGPTLDAALSHPKHRQLAEKRGVTTHSQLRVFSLRGGLLTSFAMLATAGVFCGNLVFGSQNPGEEVFGHSDTDLLLYPPGAGGDVTPATALVLTEFYFVLLFPTRLVAISRLTKEVEWKKEFAEPIISLTHDPLKNFTFFCTSNRVFELTVLGEDKDVWEKYLGMNKFEEALQYAKTPSQKDQIWTARAEYYFREARYELAATCYSKTKKAFEEICLKFLGVSQYDALRTFLRSKLDHLHKRDSTQFTLISTWLVQMYLNKFHELAQERQDASQIKEEFQQFLEDFSERLDYKTTFNLIASHGDLEQLFFYSRLMKEHESLLQYNIHHHHYKEALDVLSTESNLELLYKHLPILMENMPSETVNVLIKNAHRTDARRILPALMRYEAKVAKSLGNGRPRSEEHQGIRYLQSLVTDKKNQDPAIHNYLLYLYAKHCDEGPLFNFLKQKGTTFDLQYALRICTEHDKQQACVWIYSKMEMYEEAIELALKMGSLDLAKAVANLPTDNSDNNLGNSSRRSSHSASNDNGLLLSEQAELQKKLWLRIARHVVEEEKQIQKAMAFLKDCPLLKIEDILPFFPDFVLIDDFKDEICNSIKAYNKDLEDLQAEMVEATESAELIREDIKLTRDNYTLITAGQKCYLCGYPLLSQSCYVFPCHHSFHSRCLQEEMKQYLEPEQRSTLSSLQQKISQIENPKPKTTTTTSAPSSVTLTPGNFTSTVTSSLEGFAGNLPSFSKLENLPDFFFGDSSEEDKHDTPLIFGELQDLKEKIDQIIANECFLCNNIMIDSIDVPFVDPETSVAANNTWKVAPVLNL